MVDGRKCVVHLGMPAGKPETVSIIFGYEQSDFNAGSSIRYSLKLGTGSGLLISVMCNVIT